MAEMQQVESSGKQGDEFVVPSLKDKVVDLEISISEPKLEYMQPSFAVEPSADVDYGLDVIKSGTIIDRICFKNRKADTFLVIGRLPLCDIQLEHPTISRYHCIIQYGEDLINKTGKGWFIYDLGSTHGTKLNKKMIPSKQYIRIRVGHVLQFGGSTRIMTLFGPSCDTEPEWKYSPTEMRQLINQKKLCDKMEQEKQKESQDEESNDGITWGIDFDEEEAYAHSCELTNFQDQEEKYRDDPLKVLSRFFEQEGFDMEFTYEEEGSGHNHKWTCTIELPINTATGQSLIESATCCGSKKESQVLCAFNACKTLDRHGVLYRSLNKTRRKAKNLAENDYYDSDEDTYFDRTGQIEENREKRRLRDLKMQDHVTAEVETLQTLMKKITSIDKEVSEVEARLALYETSKKMRNDEDDEDLDKYCKRLEKHYNEDNNSMSTKAEKSLLRQRLVYLKHEKERLEKLAKIAQPVELPPLKIPSSNSIVSLSASTIKKLMKIRRDKCSAANRKENSDSKEPPSDTFIIESVDSSPFIPEVEDDEKSRKTISVEVMLNNETDFNRKQSKTSAEEECPKRKRIRMRNTFSRQEKNSGYEEITDRMDEDYITWMPPENQSGDGTTSLNAKFKGRY
ncbi:unnamed protein product [Thelazia callipaeda]|uniref:FHA domain-containing protein n=1 Tax=Thelazia callipaeda TaxID=103827 RepID=A0A0N5CYH0_THECL|nr:unnamed protein product [Thelazia callipaeda]